ncbi:dihydrodipicolinate synthase family protein [Arenibacter sp. ARW7G5Y1]|uniref:dihydrodipicolinate synthase family protein n=1 Tax=Arenibacter sp. ARW7G5Y1 TaxID=2135619 RepID=UPI000D95EE6E|nr:dihydrodipicolinate synthase family protein [Arenibacter sp. ARW7G5Y1]PXX31259.1 4-hydroxy-tetrahydrodipicolinate synthase [Arenibacter sp. ARW7G5Y1]
MLAEKELYPLKGIVTVLNTPFTALDTIDPIALKNNVLQAVEAGVAGILVPAMAAEVYKLSQTERLRMLSLVLETVGDKVPVIGGAGEQDLSKSKELLKAYLDIGCKNTLFQIPFANDSQFRNHFMELAALDPEMIMLQDWDATGYGLSDELIVDLFEKVAAFKCLKIETVPAGPKYSRILKLTQGKLNLSGGWAVTQMMEGLQRGIHAFMPTGMHFIYTTIYRLFEEGRMVEAEALFEKIVPVLAFSNQHLDISIHFFKRLLYRQGIYNTPKVRRPIMPFDALHQKLADRHIDRILQLENELKEERSNGI